ncbi:ROK family transcriptional regulator [Glutamicibacter sp. AOP5-A2-18]|uniref:ROK family transcriptional regulator n=1 Tax=Glutamicibacter sp. AOP5-A2-18 TaxID=3457656 RepID=UPI004033C7F5
MSSETVLRRDGTFLSHGGAVLPTHGREQNLSLVLQTLMERGALSRAEISRATKLTRVTVSELVAELLLRGHVIETGPKEGKRPGKPATLVDLNRPGLRIIGVDLSGILPFRAAIMDLDGTLLQSFTLDSHEQGATGETATAQLLELVNQALAQCTEPVVGIGIGTPGIVTEQGVVRLAEKFDWVDYDLRNKIQQATNTRTHVLNDADCATLAEHTFGHGSEHMLLLRLGRGVGCGVITHNTLVRGSKFAAGELGHVKQDPIANKPCSCGETGCLETYASVPAILQAIASGQSAEEVGQQASVALANALAPLISVLDIRNVIFTGPPEVVNPQMAQWLLDALAERSRTARGEDFQLNISDDPERLVLRGTAVNVLFHELGIS